MTDDTDAPKDPATGIEDRSFVDVLKSLLGQTVTMVNPESYEDSPLGHKIRAGVYRARLTGMGRDYIVAAAEYVRADKELGKEPAKQYIPIEKIKRVSLTKSERLIHI